MNTSEITIKSVSRFRKKGAVAGPVEATRQLFGAWLQETEAFGKRASELRPRRDAPDHDFVAWGKDLAGRGDGLLKMLHEQGLSLVKPRKSAVGPKDIGAIIRYIQEQVDLMEHPSTEAERREFEALLGF